MLVTIRGRSEALVADEMLDVQHAAQRLPFGVLDRRDHDPVVVLGAVQAVQRGEPGEVAVEAGPVPRFPTDEEHVGREDHAAVEQRGPQLLTLAGALAVEEREQHADDRQQRVRRVAHPEAVVERCVALGAAPASYSRPAAAW